MQVNDSEIVVAAQRREETANSVGMGIQAVTGEQLVVWATADPNFAVEPVFEANAPSLHARRCISLQLITIIARAKAPAPRCSSRAARFNASNGVQRERPTARSASS